jgi:hypothetical protein
MSDFDLMPLADWSQKLKVQISEMKMSLVIFFSKERKRDLMTFSNVRN